MTTGAKGVDPVSERTWKVLVGLHGVPPKHNVFVDMARQKKEISRTQARHDFQVLLQRHNGHPEETHVNERVTIESPAPVETDAGELAALRRQVQAQGKELSDLRHLVQTLAPPRAVEGDVPLRLARVEARVASQDRAIQHVEEHVQGVVKVLEGKMVTIMCLEEFLTKLKTDEGFWQDVRRVARKACEGMPEKHLYPWIHTVAERELDQNDRHF